MPETAYAYYSKYVNHKLVQSPTPQAAISSTVLVLGICYYVFWWDLRQARACITLVCLSSASYESPPAHLFRCKHSDHLNMDQLWGFWIAVISVYRFHSDSYIQSGRTHGKLE